MDDTSREELAELIRCLVANDHKLGQQVTALAMVCAYLLKERCELSNDPVSTLARVEGELGGLAEAIAHQTKTNELDMPNRSLEITRLVDSILVQTGTSITPGQKP